MEYSGALEGYLRGHSGELKLDLACVQELEKRYSSQVLDKMRWLIHPDPEVAH